MRKTLVGRDVGRWCIRTAVTRVSRFMVMVDFLAVIFVLAAKYYKNLHKYPF